jgi:hypothetical protein
VQRQFTDALRQPAGKVGEGWRDRLGLHGLAHRLEHGHDSHGGDPPGGWRQPREPVVRQRFDGVTFGNSL